jgi:hypothetical protein
MTSSESLIGRTVVPSGLSAYGSPAAGGRGTPEEISAFVSKIRATKDTLNVDYVVIPVDKFAARTETA